MALTTKNLIVGYGDSAVLEPLNLRLRRGELTILIGKNGCGKSTLLRSITGTQPVLGGEIEECGEPLSTLSPAKMARRIGLVLTDRTGGGGLRVDELVAIGRHPYSGFLGRLNADDRSIVAEALKSVGLEAKAGEFVASLSDGERQKAMIARAIAQQTDIVVLDEPTSFLDVAARFEILGLLSDMAHKQGITILLSTHDIAPAMAVADNVWAVAGRELKTAPKAEIVASGVLNNVYPGAVFDPQANDFRAR